MLLWIQQGGSARHYVCMFACVCLGRVEGNQQQRLAYIYLDAYRVRVHARVHAGMGV